MNEPRLRPAGPYRGHDATRQVEGRGLVRVVAHLAREDDRGRLAGILSPGRNTPSPRRSARRRCATPAAGPARRTKASLSTGDVTSSRPKRYGARASKRSVRRRSSRAVQPLRPAGGVARGLLEQVRDGIDGVEDDRECPTTPCASPAAAKVLDVEHVERVRPRERRQVRGRAGVPRVGGLERVRPARAPGRRSAACGLSTAGIRRRVRRPRAAARPAPSDPPGGRSITRWTRCPSLASVADQLERPHAYPGGHVGRDEEHPHGGHRGGESRLPHHRRIARSLTLRLVRFRPHLLQAAGHVDDAHEQGRRQPAVLAVVAQPGVHEVDQRAIADLGSCSGPGDGSSRRPARPRSPTPLSWR